MKNIKANEKKHVPSIIIVLYTMFVMCSLCLTNKIIDIDGYLISGCLVAFPIMYFFGDIIAEVYGYVRARRILWQILIAGLAFSAIILLIIGEPSPKFYNNTKDFENVFGLSMKFIIVGTIAVWAGAITNAFLISKWKILVTGNL